MRSSSVVKTLVMVLGCSLLAGPAVFAEDTKGKWQFGFGLAYMSISDSIRSNSDVAISNNVLTDQGLPEVVFVDPRPDANVLNEPSIQDSFKFDVNASYGLTRWLALEIWGSYMKAPVGNIEVYIDDITVTPNDGSPTTPGPISNCGPSGTGTCYTYTSSAPLQTRLNTFVPVGEITMIPIQLSALFRFRPESPFDPYLGAGIGYTFANMDTSSEFQAVSNQIANRNISRVCGGEISYCDGDPPPSVKVPDADLDSVFDAGALTVEVQDAFGWHLAAGVDYYMNERFSIYVDARYAWSSGQVDIKSSDFHQVQVTAIDEGRLFLKTQDVWDATVTSDSSLWGTPYYWEDQGPLANAAFHGRCPECKGSGFFETEDKNGNGLYDAAEDDGILYVLPPGSFDPGERLGEIFCADCVNNGFLADGNTYGSGQRQFGITAFGVNTDSEDVNYSRSMDRFLSYGLDICTTPEGVGNPACSKTALNPSTPDRYVLPSGCDSNPPSAVDFRMQEGCPRPRPGPSTNRDDNTDDNYTVQGGEIRYDGFALGVGLKLTF